MYVSSEWFMNRLAYIGAHFVAMATPKVCKKCSLLKIKLFKMSMIHRNAVITEGVGGGGDDYIYFSDTDVPRENQRRAQSRGRFSHKLPTQIRGKSYML